MIDGLNRAVLTVFALLLVAAGTVVLASSAGLLVLDEPPALYGRFTASVRAYGEIWWPALIGGAVVVLLLAATWALRQMIVRRTGEGLSMITLEAGDRGRTTVDAATIARAAAADLGRTPQVTASTARLVHDSAGRQLRTRIDVFADADLAAVDAATCEVYERVAAMLGDEQLATHTRIRPVAGEPRRVR